MAFGFIVSVSAKNPRMEESVVSYYARCMDVSDSLLGIPKLYETIDEWIGTPYRYGRRDKKGTDCSGFVGNVFHALCGQKLPASAAGISQIIQPKSISELKEGDLVFFNYRGRTNSHVGIYLQNGWFVHASTVYGVTLANLHSRYYTARFAKGGSLKQGKLKDLMETYLSEDERMLPLPKTEPLIPLKIYRVEPSNEVRQNHGEIKIAL